MASTRADRRALWAGVLVVVVIIGAVFAVGRLRAKPHLTAADMPFLGIGGPGASILLAKVVSVTPPHVPPAAAPGPLLVTMPPPNMPSSDEDTNGNARFKVIETLAGKPVSDTIEITIPADYHKTLTDAVPSFRPLEVGQYWVLVFASRTGYHSPIDIATDFRLVGRPLKTGPNGMWMTDFRRHARLLADSDRVQAMLAAAGTLFDDKLPLISRVAAYQTIDQIVQLGYAERDSRAGLLSAMRDRFYAQVDSLSASDPAMHKVLDTAHNDQTYPW